MKTFSTSGTGNQQTLSEIETDKIPVYSNETDLDADLANLADGQIVAIKDEGSELSAPVDTVQGGNMHAVTSNAVAESFGEWVSVFNSGAIKGIETKNGKYLALHIQGTPSTYGQTIGWIVDPKYIPQSALYIPCVNTAFLVIGTNGSIVAYSSQGGNIDLYCDTIVLVA